MHLIFQTSNRETQLTLLDPDIYIQYRNFPTAIVRVLFLVHCWRGRDGYLKGSGYYCRLADPCLWFLSSIAEKAFSYFIS